jgi:hypothetical protein
MSPHDLWRFLPLGYLLTILIETPILLIGLSAGHPWHRRLLAGVWLTACTYPIVVLVLPVLLNDQPRTVYLLVAEVFAPVAECVLFWLAFGKNAKGKRSTMLRDFAAIVIANFVSFLVGEVFVSWQWFGLMG